MQEIKEFSPLFQGIATNDFVDRNNKPVATPSQTQLWANGYNYFLDFFNWGTNWIVSDNGATDPAYEIVYN